MNSGVPSNNASNGQQQEYDPIETPVLDILDELILKVSTVGNS
jgi:hypothetical protein